MAPYPSGKGEVCKTFMRRFESARRLRTSPATTLARSLVASAAGVAKLVDAQDLKSCSSQGECRFDSGPRHAAWKRALSSVG